MTEGVKQEAVVEEGQVTEVQLSDLEQEQLSAGWKPKDQWIADGGSPDEWRPAKEFKERGELFNKIETLSRELKGTKSTLTALKGHYERVKDTEFKRALDTLKAEKKQALESGDADAVIEIDEKIAETRETQRAQIAADKVAEPEISPVFTQWVNRNQWYQSDSDLQIYADGVGRAYAQANPGIDPVQVLKYVEDKVKATFKDKFSNPRRTAPSSVEGSRTPAKVSRGEIEMDEAEKAAMNKFVRSGIMTKEQYIADLKKVKGIA